MEKRALVKLPVLDLKEQYLSIRSEVDAAVRSVLESGTYILGAEVQALEEEVASYLGVKYAVGLASGTDALVLSLRALRIGQGDEVITTPFTFFATAEAISLLGATPVFVDIDPKTFNIDPSRVEPAITERTRAILPVHLYGQSANMEPLLALAAKHGLKVIEDVAQAFGATFKTRKVGTLGDVGCFSFFPSKNLGAYGDAGLLATNDEEVAETVRLLRAHGARKKYYHELLGYNSRLDTLQAAILRVKLRHLDQWNNSRRRLAESYTKLLGEAQGVLTPYEAPYRTHVYHQYTVRISAGARERVRHELATRGIETKVYYPVPLHRLPLYSSHSRSFEEAELAAKEVLSLPIWPELSENVVEFVARQIRSLVEQA